MDTSLFQTLSLISSHIWQTHSLGNINSGGCAYLAAYVKHHLDFIGVESRFVYIDERNRDDSPEQVIERIMDEGSRGSASHVILQIGKYYFDAHGIVEDLYDYQFKYGFDASIIPFEMSAKEYFEYAIVKKRYDWSHWYDYKRNDSILKSIINQNFELWYNKRNEVTKARQAANELLSLK